MPRLLLPGPRVDLARWAVIACDQHTSDPGYWERVASTVGEAPSTLRLVYPEVYLGEQNDSGRIEQIHRSMREYLDNGLLVEHEPAMALTIRRTPHVDRRVGLLLAVDLEQYDFTPGTRSLIRASEETIVERIPPRVRIRKGAPVELPHVLVLVDDPSDSLLGPLSAPEALGTLERLYETDLMLGGGHVEGYRVDGARLEHVVSALEALLERSDSTSPFLFAVGDGNHSLATAKAVWESMKGSVAAEHPARYALVEVVNIYDPGLRFEPIHRLVRTSDPDLWVVGLAAAIGGVPQPRSREDLRDALEGGSASVGYLTADGCGLIAAQTQAELPVATVQAYIDEHEPDHVDYIHGWDASVELASGANSVVVVLPRIDRGRLFATVAGRGVLPRKAFSLGEAEEKRYYLEVRRISPDDRTARAS